ncbi:pimeloyl-ACP methyl ester esterase BioH [Chromobacterium subtsugae]|uniref:Pimeloyl-[acyl-carrier protein] methyl ester esterase n=1 Tax=Chromobacterium subtsugae TaxID=251747 RepID=A0ABS7F8M8_9NEIS|nr:MULTISPECIES: pimeloyl-ACP methyl ester esterase BioH [Chromobacterium]KUM00414.1 pimeloyl-[acyl-carrier protein] methyl ester esterase [Chromobacterium subtsugae]KZE86697.1 pimeloyl-[acyl-carrier protein] methyl ester esterase [Chromobacterium sp. F49]MBW7565145.1 pimeloyl-ACP methyl ester esterase BioH [Chromobacterium subtsugae]MBW8286327.1 pimeloyl-ACP methyl ester esterase BioH [Chromobacterium subtsugae]WSE91629.1 pimeloyl-ACP methyl ester esterase BioH [Chromobacterium subtsugae]
MNLFVETLGQGPDVVMLHGWGLHGGVFARVAEHLAGRFCVHLVDLPGHGASPALAGFDADAVADLVASHFPLPVQVVGWSLGGLIAQHWAARHPERVKSLALVSTSPRFVRDETWPHAQERKAIEAVAASLDGAFEQTLERFLALQMMGAPAARDTLKSLRGELFSHGRPQGLLPALQLLLEADARSLAGRIRCPAALFCGARDAITPIGAGRWLAEALPDAVLYEFPQASHAPFLSHEQDFVRALAQHLEAQA